MARAGPREPCRKRAIILGDPADHRFGKARLGPRAYRRRLPMWNVRVLQMSRGRDLGQEPLGAQNRREFGMQHFDAELAHVAHIASQVHRGNALATEFADEVVTVSHRRGEGGGQAHS